MRYESKTILQIIVDRADDSALDALLMNPSLQFLYPVKGLEWVQYAGKGLCKTVINSIGLIPFDPHKIKNIKYVTESNKPDLIIDTQKSLKVEL